MEDAEINTNLLDEKQDETTFKIGALAVIYVALFVITWQESFPGTALQYLMTYKLHMSLPAISTNDALIYMPFNWKPIYSWLSDNFALCGYHRIPYFFLGAVVAIVGYLATARARSAGVLLLFCVLSSIGTATMNLMVDTLIVDAVGCRELKASALQGWANASKWLGTGVAQICAYFVYTRNSAEVEGQPPKINSRLAISVTAIAPGVLALLAPMLPERRGNLESNRSKRLCDREASLLTLIVLIFQSVLVLIGIRNLMSKQHWQLTMLIVVPMALLLLIALHCQPWIIRGCQRLYAGRSCVQYRECMPDRASCKWAFLSFFIFLTNTIPSSDIAVGQLKLRVFTASSYQWLHILGAAVSVVVSSFFAIFFKNCGMVTILTVSTILSSVLALSDLPFIFAALRGIPPDGSITLWSTLGGWAIFSSCVGSASLCSVLGIDTLITFVASSVGPERRSIVFSLLISLYSTGPVVKGLMEAAALESLGLDGSHWAALPMWTCLTAVLRLLILLFLPLVKFCVPSDSNVEASPPPESFGEGSDEGQADRQLSLLSDSAVPLS